MKKLVIIALLAVSAVGVSTPIIAVAEDIREEGPRFNNLNCKKTRLSAGFSLRKFALDFFALKDLDDIFGTNIIIVFKGHTAFLAGLDVFNFVLKAFQCFQRAFMDHNVVAQQAYTC